MTSPEIEDAEFKNVKRGVTLLYEVSRAIVSRRYLDEILALVVGLTADLTGSKICSVMLLDDNRKELVIKATQSLSKAYRSKPPLKVGESISGAAVERKQPVTVLDVREEKGYRHPEMAKKESLISMAAVPMMIQDRVIGVLNCYTSVEHVFTEDEIRLLTGVANQAAIAIDNTRLVSEKIEAVEKLETRKKVERAKGILMKKKGLAEDEAYRLLQKQSMSMRRSLGEIAEAVIVSAEVLN